MFANCQKEKKKATTIENSNQMTILDPTKLVKKTTPLESKEIALKTLNNEVLQSLKTKDHEKFSNYIHPEKGISFSMYAFVDSEKDKHFSCEEFLNYINKKTKFTWGEKDGTGDLLVLSINDYLQDQVFAKDFTKAQYYLNEFKGGGNSLNNLKKIYPDKDFTENFLPGTAEFGEMDWNSLRFVFDEFEGKFYIIAVINDQWTI